MTEAVDHNHRSTAPCSDVLDFCKRAITHVLLEASEKDPYVLYSLILEEDSTNEGTTTQQHEIFGGVEQLPEKDVVPLVVEGGYLPPLEVGVLRKQGSKHPAHSSPHQCVKVFKDQLCLEFACSSMTLQREDVRAAQPKLLLTHPSASQNGSMLEAP